MTTYRVLKPLSTGHRQGELVQGTRFAPGVVTALVANHALAPISGPDLTNLAGWTIRAGKLAKMGIVTVQDFLNADGEKEWEIAQAFEYKTTRAIKRWRRELESLLTVEPPRGG